MPATARTTSMSRKNRMQAERANRDFFHKESSRFGEGGGAFSLFLRVTRDLY